MCKTLFLNLIGHCIDHIFIRFLCNIFFESFIIIFYRLLTIIFTECDVFAKTWATLLLYMVFGAPQNLIGRLEVSRLFIGFQHLLWEIENI